MASNAHARWVSHSVLAALVIVLGTFPWGAPALGLDYYVDFVRRILIVSIAALSLNFLIGRAGLVALGHAGFVGVGAYAVVAMVEGGYSNAWLIWLVAAVAGFVVSGLIGLVAVRTRGVYFIMITLAFAQMLYYLAVSLRMWGGDDGYTMYSPLQLWDGVDAQGNGLFSLVLLAFASLFWCFRASSALTLAALWKAFATTKRACRPWATPRCGSSCWPLRWQAALPPCLARCWRRKTGLSAPA